MGISLLRRPSDEATVMGSDDARILRYALSGYNGVTKNYGNECTCEYSGGVFKINSGEIILDGYQTVIDDVGESINVNNSSTKLYYSIYAEYDLRVSENQKTTIKSLYATDAYPVIPVGNDLTKTQHGLANMILYTFEINKLIISNVLKKFELLELGVVKRSIISDRAIVATKVDSEIAAEASGVTQEQSDNSNKLATTSYVRQAISDVKNIIKANVTRAGAVVGEVRRQVNFVLISLHGIAASADTVGLVPEGFRPKSEQVYQAAITIPFMQTAVGGAIVIVIRPNGTIYIESDRLDNTINLINITIGYSIE